MAPYQQCSPDKASTFTLTVCTLSKSVVCLASNVNNVTLKLFIRVASEATAQPTNVGKCAVTSLHTVAHNTCVPSLWW